MASTAAPEPRKRGADGGPWGAQEAILEGALRAAVAGARADGGRQLRAAIGGLEDLLQRARLALSQVEADEADREGARRQLSDSHLSAADLSSDEEPSRSPPSLDAAGHGACWESDLDRLSTVSSGASGGSDQPAAPSEAPPSRRFCGCRGGASLVLGLCAAWGLPHAPSDLVQTDFHATPTIPPEAPSQPVGLSCHILASDRDGGGPQGGALEKGPNRTLKATCSHGALSLWTAQGTLPKASTRGAHLDLEGTGKDVEARGAAGGDCPPAANGLARDGGDARANGAVAAGPPAAGEFDWAAAEPLPGPPEVRTLASYSRRRAEVRPLAGVASSCLRSRGGAQLGDGESPEAIDVVSPAWSVRVLQEVPEAPHIDLCLERSLEPLQAPDGGFELTVELVAALGLAEPGRVLAEAAAPDARVLGALLVLKAAAHYMPERWPPLLWSVCSRAEGFASGHLGLTSEGLWAALGAVGDALEPPASLPGRMVAALLANFAPPGRWSFFELWPRLLSESTRAALREEGACFCPRFFLVDLACAGASPYDIDRGFPLVRRGASLFVGQPGGEDGGGRDAMRQGRQLEAALVSFGWLEEDHVLTELRLPSPASATGPGGPGQRGAVRAVYSAAPDAVEAHGDALAAAAEPLRGGDEQAYEAAGYTLEAVLPVATGAHEKCRIWRSQRQGAPAGAYVEVKKTTHLQGSPGVFKITKFWLQAALMGCGGVVVATTQGSSDGNVACGVRRMSVEQCEQQVEAWRIWGMLESMLRHILQATAASQGRWTLRIQKVRGYGARVKLLLQPGWHSDEWLLDDGLAGIEERLIGLFD
ncbi:unnamed protein product [Prorocentrum cordatum]|nr:unnamed protein product [Polarella glacialis]